MLTLLIYIIAIYIVLYIILYIFQGKFLFFPQKLPMELIAIIHRDFKNAEEINLTTDDNVRLHGWFLKNSKVKPAPLIIFFGGNSDDVTNYVINIDNLKNWNTALINYRSYGLSEGQPNEKNLFKDSLAIYDYFASRPDINKEKIIVMGHSLGTGVAIYVAQNRPVKKIVLISPYANIKNVAQNIFILFPVKFMLRNKFDSLSRAPLIKTPLLAIAATKDLLIPISHTINLIKHWAGPSELKLIWGDGHHSVVFNDLCWQYVNEFINAKK